MNAIEVKNLTKSYGKFHAVEDISFNVKKGSVCAILGSNGSGKTTTIKSISNLIIPDGGEIKLFGEDNKKSSDKITAIFEGTRNLYWRLTPPENLRYFAGIRGLGGKEIEKKIDKLLDKFNLSDKRNETVNRLSRGMQQKIAIAMTLISNTDIILLDEPTLGLDIQSFMDIKDILKDISKNMNKTVLLSTHDMNLVQDVCDYVVILKNGKIVAQDKIESLLDMFKSMTYEIVLTEDLSEENKEDIRKLEYNFHFNNKEKVIEIDIFDLRDVYGIVEKLKEKNILIKEIKQKEVDFERVYLQLTK
ncbi:ABC transporter ATP-binding protein [Clostridium botulinum]|nr:ABC transporter ATP-binding protein [Clostridium botulinum]